MTINKSQMQTLQEIAIYLPAPVFAHGLIYVALSRVGDPAK
jgi:ATP-dependent DNA helicase PIF1